MHSKPDWVPLSDADLHGIGRKLRRVAMVVGLAFIVALPVTAHFVGDGSRSETPDAESVLLNAFPRGAVDTVSCREVEGLIAYCSYSIGSMLHGGGRSRFPPGSPNRQVLGPGG
jgi:hypothetical protein